MHSLGHFRLAALAAILCAGFGGGLRAAEPAAPAKAAVPEGPQPVALIATRLLEGDPTVPGNEFAISARIVRNDTSTTAIAVCVRLFYTRDALELVETTAAECGPLLTSEAQMESEGSVEDFRTVMSLGNMRVKTLTPECFRARFRVKPEARAPYGIRVADETRPGTEPVVSIHFTGLPRAYDNSAVQMLSAPPGDAKP